jgi:hypothetical protein
MIFDRAGPSPKPYFGYGAKRVEMGVLFASEPSPKQSLSG